MNKVFRPWSSGGFALVGRQNQKGRSRFMPFCHAAGTHTLGEVAHVEISYLATGTTELVALTSKTVSSRIEQVRRGDGCNQAG